MTTLYLIRHAEAEGNVFRRLQGQFDSMITPNGLKQIRALSQRFKDIPIHAVYASDLTRTCTTARAVFEPKGLPLHREPRFREMGCGIWENQPFGWLNRTDPGKNRAFSQDPQNWSVEGSESFRTYTGRFLEALEETAQRHEGQTAAIFSHGMVMRGVMQRLFFPEKQNLGHSENTAVTKLIYENGAYRLEYLNDASHLPPEITTVARQTWWKQGGYEEHNLWYRDAAPEDEALINSLGCGSGAGQLRLACAGEETLGLVAVRPRGEAAELTHLSLLPQRPELAPQLLGEGLSLARDMGAKRLVAASGACPQAEELLRDFGILREGLILDPKKLSPKIF